jgi:hypothetical protein
MPLGHPQATAPLIPASIYMKRIGPLAMVTRFLSGAGASGFRDFPHLAGDEGESQPSRRTLPAYLSLPSTDVHGENDHGESIQNPAGGRSKLALSHR